MADALRLYAVLGLAIMAGCASHPVEPSDRVDAEANPAAPSGLAAVGGLSGDTVTFRCESDHGRRHHCDIDPGGNVVLSRRLSKAPCVQGRNWDVDQGGIWVAAGCRAE